MEDTKNKCSTVSESAATRDSMPDLDFCVDDEQSLPQLNDESKTILSIYNCQPEYAFPTNSQFCSQLESSDFKEDPVYAVINYLLDKVVDQNLNTKNLIKSQKDHKHSREPVNHRYPLRMIKQEPSVSYQLEAEELPKKPRRRRKRRRSNMAKDYADYSSLYVRNFRPRMDPTSVDPGSSIKLRCSIIKVGSFKCQPEDGAPFLTVHVTSSDFSFQILKANVVVQFTDIMEMITHFSKKFPVMFLDVTAQCVANIMVALYAQKGICVKHISKNEWLTQRRLAFFITYLSLKDQCFLHQLEFKRLFPTRFVNEKTAIAMLSEKVDPIQVKKKSNAPKIISKIIKLPSDSKLSSLHPVTKPATVRYVKTGLPDNKVLVYMQKSIETNSNSTHATQSTIENTTNLGPYLAKNSDRKCLKLDIKNVPFYKNRPNKNIFDISKNIFDKNVNIILDKSEDICNDDVIGVEGSTEKNASDVFFVKSYLEHEKQNFMKNSLEVDAEPSISTENCAERNMNDVFFVKDYREVMKTDIENCFNEGALPVEVIFNENIQENMSFVECEVDINYPIQNSHLEEVSHNEKFSVEAGAIKEICHDNTVDSDEIAKSDNLEDEMKTEQVPALFDHSHNAPEKCEYLFYEQTYHSDTDTKCVSLNVQHLNNEDVNKNVALNEHASSRTAQCENVSSVNIKLSHTIKTEKLSGDEHSETSHCERSVHKNGHKRTDFLNVLTSSHCDSKLVAQSSTMHEMATTSEEAVPVIVIKTEPVDDGYDESTHNGNYILSDLASCDDPVLSRFIKPEPM